MVGFLSFTTGLLLGMISMTVIFLSVCMDKLNEVSTLCETTLDTLECYQNKETEL